jgi:hypothetical protein
MEPGLSGAIFEQNGNSIDNGIAARAAETENGIGLQLKGLMAGWADDPAQIVRSQRSSAHRSIL